MVSLVREVVVPYFVPLVFLRLQSISVILSLTQSLLASLIKLQFQLESQFFVDLLRDPMI